MGRSASGQILTSADSDGGTTYSERFRGSGYPKAVILLGSSRDGWTRARAEHESRIVAAQIRAGTWLPVPTPENETTERLTFRELASAHYHRKRGKGLRPNSRADMLNKLSAHLLPFFAEYRVDEIDESLVEEYIDHKQRENAKLAALEASGRPALARSSRPLRQLKPATINTHLHLLAEILDRAVRDGHLARNPARGEDLRLAVRREHRFGLELDEAWSLIEAAGQVDRQGTRSDELREQIVALRVDGLGWAEIGARVGRAPTTCIHQASAGSRDRCRCAARSSPPSSSAAAHRRAVRVALRACRSRSPRHPRDRRQDLGRGPHDRHPRRPTRRADRLPESENGYLQGKRLSYRTLTGLNKSSVCGLIGCSWARKSWLGPKSETTDLVAADHVSDGISGVGRVGDSGVTPRRVTIQSLDMAAVMKR